MKTIGLLGGMSWKSSAIYYQILNQEIAKIFPDLSSAKIFMQSVNFGEIEPLMRQRDWDKIAKILIQSSKIIQNAGADFLVIATNTMHKLFEEIAKNISIPILHIADATAEILAAHQITKVGLLGTKFYYARKFL